MSSSGISDCKVSADGIAATIEKRARRSAKEMGTAGPRLPISLCVAPRDQHIMESEAAITVKNR